MNIRHYLAMAAALVLCCLECSNAKAEPGSVDAAQLCRVQNTIRWRERAWTPAECQRVAGAFNATRDPRQMLAVAIVESDLRERAINVSKPGVYDIGLMGVRCVTIGARAEAIGASSSVASQVGSAPRLLGSAIHRTSANSDLTPTPRDRCTNGAARGLYAHQLLDPTINIRTAAAVLESHGGSLLGYSGSTKERGYGARIAALVAAFGGELRIPKGAHGKKWARVRELAKRIVQAINERKRS